MSKKMLANSTRIAIVLWAACGISRLDAGDCGCESAPRTCYCQKACCVHRCRCCCMDCQVPYGVVVPSAPAYAAPLVAAAPYYAAAPVQMAPVNYAPSYAPQQAPSQCSSSQAAPSNKSEEQLLALLRAALGQNGGSGGGAAAPTVPADTELADRVTKVEKRVTDLEALSVQLGKIIAVHDQKLKAISP